MAKKAQPAPDEPDERDEAKPSGYDAADRYRVTIDRDVAEVLIEIGQGKKKNYISGLVSSYLRHQLIKEGWLTDPKRFFPPPPKRNEEAE